MEVMRFKGEGGYGRVELWRGRAWGRMIRVELDRILLVEPRQGSIDLWIIVEGFVQWTAIKPYRANVLYNGGLLGTIPLIEPTYRDV